MGCDPHGIRFVSYLSLFTFFMLVLVSSDNLVVLFFGWEGIGLASYLLIGFWYTRIQAVNAALKAVIINRVGDFFFLFAIFAIYSFFGSVDFSFIFALLPFLPNYLLCNFYGFSINMLDLISLFLLLAVAGKSAQIGLHTWLPDAMEGPTPVSALIHAATLVTAGVFLIIKCSPIFEFSPNAPLLFLMLGTMTNILGAYVGLFQTDIKKVIAYSTCSQLGYMVSACGISSYSVSFYHLVNHAFFKALLFLSAGSVIHSLSNEQEFEKSGGLANILPLTYSAVLIGSAALTAQPFFAGFYSKDMLLELVSLSGGSYLFDFSYYFGLLCAILTGIYSNSLVDEVFDGLPSGYKKIFFAAKEGSFCTVIPLIVLSLLSIFFGYFSQFIFDSVYGFYKEALFFSPEFFNFFERESIPYYIQIFPLILGFIFLFIFDFFYFDFIDLRSNLFNVDYSFKLLSFNKVYFDYIYFSTLQKNILFQSSKLFTNIERGLLEVLGPYGLTKSSDFFFYPFSKIHSGWSYNSICLLVLCIIWLFVFFL
jgi:proton-translocating NADH-quinone oxidoreductase chain L